MPMPTTTTMPTFLKNSPFDWWLSAGQTKLPAEVDEEGNVEYKWKLMGSGVDEERRRHLVTQMRWRVAEGGHGHCWYILGVKDKGTLDGLSEDELRETLNVMEDLVRRGELFISAKQVIQIQGTPDHSDYLNESVIQTTIQTSESVNHISATHPTSYSVTHPLTRMATHPATLMAARYICQLKIESLNFQMNVCDLKRDLKIALLGDSGSGKTTLMSVLTDEAGGLDDGRGGMRARLLHHRHELLSGSTSSITQRSLVFNDLGDVSSDHSHQTQILPLPSDPALLQPGLKRQILNANKCIHLIDSAGKLRFDRSMLAVLTSLRRVDGVCLVVEAPTDNHPPTRTLTSQTRSLLSLIRGLQLPLLSVIISKIDHSSTERLSVLLEELGEAVGQPLQLFEDELPERGILPVLLCSAKSGEYLPTLRHFFSLQDGAIVAEQCDFELLAEQPTIQSAFVIESVAKVPQIGTVVWGQVALGTLAVDSELSSMVSGTEAVSRFTVASIERLKIPVKVAQSGQYVSLALQGSASESLQRGQLLCLFSSASDSTSSGSGSGSTSIYSSITPTNTTTIPTPNLQFKPLKRIIAELTVTPLSDKRTLNGLLFVGSQRFGAQMDLEVRGQGGRGSKKVCLVTVRGGAKVFLQPGAGLVFVETGAGSRERFIGRVIDYFGC